jgi:hypothetical protein
VTEENIRDVVMSLRAGYRVSGRVEFEGSSARPTQEQLTSIRVRLERADGQTAEPAGGFDPTQDGAVSSDGTFTTSSTMPGHYLLRAFGVPKGWSFKNATFEGRDVSESTLPLNADVAGVSLTLTDRSAKIEGTVTGLNGQAEERSQVLMFPVDSGAWVDYGRTTRRVRSTPVAAGKFSLAQPPAGDYLLIAIPADQLEDWQDPAFLSKVSAQAERVTVADGQPLTRALQVRRIQ